MATSLISVCSSHALQQHGCAIISGRVRARHGPVATGMSPTLRIFLAINFTTLKQTLPDKLLNCQNDALLRLD